MSLPKEMFRQPWLCPPIPSLTPGTPVVLFSETDELNQQKKRGCEFVWRKIGFIAMSPPYLAASLAVQREVSVEGRWQEHRVWRTAWHGTAFKPAASSPLETIH